MSDPAPAERYARASDAARLERTHPLTAAFAAAQRFTLDPFQIEGCRALEDGRSVLVAAPTGAGKTIVGEFAVHLAMRTPGDKAFYTTPMKALSNQKFRELQDVYGPDEVGLLTGDTNINGNARIVVMTTEVLRNMLYADSPALRGLRYVVMDEVHYLADDRLAGTGGRGDQHAAAVLERAASFDLERVEGEPLGCRERRRDRVGALESGGVAGARVALGGSGIAHAAGSGGSSPAALSRFALRRSNSMESPTAAKYSTHRMPPRSSIEVTSAAGVAMAAKTVMMMIATRHPLRMSRPDTTPARFRATRKTGVTNDTPITSSSLKTKS